MSFYDCLQNNIDHTYTLAAMIEAKQHSSYSLAVMIVNKAIQLMLMIISCLVMIVNKTLVAQYLLADII